MSIWAALALFLGPVFAEDLQPEPPRLLRLLQQHWIGVGLGLGVLAVLAAVAVHMWLRGWESKEQVKEEEIYISPRKVKIPRNCWFAVPKTPEVPTESTPLKSPVECGNKKMQSWVERSIVKATFLSQLHAGASQPL